MTDEIRQWQASEPFEQAEYGLFRIARFHSVSPRNGHEGTYVRLETPDWVNVIAVTSDHTLVLVRQFRHGISAVTLEIPSGIVEPGEAPLHAAQRELAEETGYVAARWSELGTVYPNPAFQTNKCTTFLAQDARGGGDLHLDPGEDIGVQVVTLHEAGDMLQSGAINHALMVAAFLQYVRHGCPAGTLFA